MKVDFLSADARTFLAGYLFEPPHIRRAPAIVLMHGRSGLYSSQANHSYHEQTLSRKHKAWATRLVENGYVVLMVDSFAPRGYVEGFAAGSYDERPEAVNEVTVRPFDAYGALRYLRMRVNVDGARIGLMGWSNGGSAVLAAMAENFLPLPEANAAKGFRAAVALYPGCGLQHKFDDGYKPYAPTRIFVGDADEVISPTLCQSLTRRSQETGGDIETATYPGATHSFDDPGKSSVEANKRAAEAAETEIENFLNHTLRV